MSRRGWLSTNRRTAALRWAGNRSQISTMLPRQRCNNERSKSMKSYCPSERPGCSEQLQSTRRRRCVTLHTPINETFFQLRSRRFNTGVCPQGAQVFCTSGVKETPDSSTKTSLARRRATFFNPRPILGDPGGDGCIVPFNRFELRLLTTESQRPEEIRQGVDVILDTVASPDDFVHSGTSPQIAVESFRPGAVEQPLPQPFTLSRRELAWFAGMRFGRQPRFAPFSGQLPPMSHRPLSRTNTLRDRCHRQSLSQQRHGLPPPSFQLFRASMRSHKPLFTQSQPIGK